jgi:TetR/AcrR family transcriptional repressor of uid operon
VAMTTDTSLPRSRREQQRLDTREQLFELAIDEFRRVGCTRARVREIVDAAGVVPGTFYFHFPTRDHVLFELWRRNSDRLADRLPSLADDAPAPSVESYLRALGDAMIDIEEEVGDIELVRDSIAVMLRPPEGADASAPGVASQIVALFSRALDRAEIASALAPPELATVLLTSLLGVLISASDDLDERRRDVRRTIDFFLKALRRDPL